LRPSIALAVTGHRYIKQTALNTPSLLSAIETIKYNFPVDDYQIHSCLAAGADQILAQLLLDNLHAVLIHVLPLDESEYLRDFNCEKSIKDYYSLKSKAKKTVRFVDNSPRPIAYRQANQYMLDNCDLLVAMWDGKPPKGVGGTGEMVGMARDRNIPLIWIHCYEEKISSVISVERLPDN